MLLFGPGGCRGARHFLGPLAKHPRYDPSVHPPDEKTSVVLNLPTSILPSHGPETKTPRKG